MAGGLLVSFFEQEVKIRLEGVAMSNEAEEPFEREPIDDALDVDRRVARLDRRTMRVSRKLDHIEERLERAEKEISESASNSRSEEPSG